MIARSLTAVALVAATALAASPALATTSPSAPLPDGQAVLSEASPNRLDADLPTDCGASAGFLDAKNDSYSIWVRTKDSDDSPRPSFWTEYAKVRMPGGIGAMTEAGGEVAGEGDERVLTRRNLVVDTTGALRVLTTKVVGRGSTAKGSVVSNVLVKKGFGAAKSAMVTEKHLYVLHTDGAFRRYEINRKDLTKVGASVKLGKGTWGYRSMGLASEMTINGKEVHRFRGITNDGKLNDVQIQVASGVASVATVGSGWGGYMGVFSGSCATSQPMAILTMAVKKDNTADLWWDVNNKGIAKVGTFSNLDLGVGRIFG